MRVLVTGANGFIGARVVAALGAAGHEVVAAMRHPVPTAGASATIACDFSRDVDPETWKPRLAGIDAVVNCAGILRETRTDTFQRVHIDAPLALFWACTTCGVRRVIQLSALGEPEDGAFIASKQHCDRTLAELDLDWLVLRPSLVYSAAGAYGGTALLRALAALPGVLIVPNGGMQRIRPLALEDLTDAVVAALAKPDLRGEIVELVGAETLTLRDYLLAWRQWFGLSAPYILATPGWLTNASVAIGEASGRGPLSRVIANLLERGRIGASTAPTHTAALLGRAPVTLAEALTRRPSQAQDLLQARWYSLRLLLLFSLVLVWLGSGIVGLLLPESSAAAQLAGWPPSLVYIAQLASSAADLVLGVLLLTGWRTRTVLALMLAMVVGYTVVIGMAAPAHWLDPFGGLLKNLAVMAVLISLLMLDERRR
jgi:uncharacterized protein YbjT (DUF2867 family)/uncharacterized membrane protein YphA (DoxX/SURF4 family)